VQALDLGSQLTLGCQIGNGELPARQAQRGEPDAGARLIHGGEQALRGRIEQRIVGQRAGRCYACHAALHRPLAEGRVAHLLANRDRLALAQRLGEIGFHSVRRYARHGQRLAARVAA